MKVRSKWIVQVCAALVAGVAVFALSGCEGGPGGSGSGASGRTAKFRSVDEHLSHTRVRAAISSSGHQINRGNSPPSVAGRPRSEGLQPAAVTPAYSAEYRVSGRVTDVSPGGTARRGTPVRSVMCLHDQTPAGTISFIERVQSVEVSAAGWISGSGEKFTTYFQSHQDLAAQMRQLAGDRGPDLGVCVADVSLIASGRLTARGDIVEFATLSTITSFHCPNLYQLAVDAGADPGEVRQAIENIENSWWRTESTAENHGTCSR